MLYFALLLPTSANKKTHVSTPIMSKIVVFFTLMAPTTVCVLRLDGCIVVVVAVLVLCLNHVGNQSTCAAY